MVSQRTPSVQLMMLSLEYGQLVSSVRVCTRERMSGSSKVFNCHARDLISRQPLVRSRCGSRPVSFKTYTTNLSARRLLVHVLHALAAVGWMLHTSCDMTKKAYDKDTLFFRACPPVQVRYHMLSADQSATSSASLLTSLTRFELSTPRTT